MEKKELLKSLENLHRELKNTESVDESSKEKIAHLMDGLQQVLDHSGDNLSEHHHDLLESLQESVEHFEVSHPTLTKVMNNLINTLKNIGI